MIRSKWVEPLVVPLPIGCHLKIVPRRGDNFFKKGVRKGLDFKNIQYYNNFSQEGVSKSSGHTSLCPLNETLVVDVCVS